MKIALISGFRSQYTLASYFEDIYIKFEIPYSKFNPKDQKNIPLDYDLFFYVDDGSEYVIYPNNRVRKILYIIDTHLGFENDISMIKFVDHVFCAQKDAVIKIKSYNKNVSWLPLGCSFDFHHSENQKKIYDIGFIGGVGSGKRKEFIEAVSKRYSNSFFGNAKKEEIGKIYSQSKIVFNASINNDINMRVFEGLCSGALLITDKIYNNGFEELIAKASEPICVFYEYTDMQDLFTKIDYYLNNEQKRLEIAQAGLKFANKNQYIDRWSEINLILDNLSINKVSIFVYYIYCFKLITKKMIRRIHKFVNTFILSRWRKPH